MMEKRVNGTRDESLEEVQRLVTQRSARRAVGTQPAWRAIVPAESPEHARQSARVW
jgi:hypothetical protein